MANYTRPQVEVHQEFRQLPQDVVANLNAFVFGPNYRLFRYSVASEKALIGLGAYDPDNDTEYAFPNQPAGSTVDLGYVKPYMEDIWALYATISPTAATACVAVSPAARNKLRAMPRVEDVDHADGGGSLGLTNGVFMESGGYVYDSPSLPETIYLWPTGGEVDDFLSRMNAWAGVWTAEDATFEYFTRSDGQRGTFDVLATNNPLTSGVRTQAPYGLVLDLDGEDPLSATAERVAARIVYTGNAGGAQDVVINGGAGLLTITTGVDYALGATARETWDNFKAYVHTHVADSTITEVFEIIHVYGADTDNGEVYLVGESGALATVTTTMANAAVTTVGGAGSVYRFNAVRQPVELTVQGAGGASFTITVDPDSIDTSIDEQIDNGLSLKFRYSVNSGGIEDVSWSDLTRRADVEYDLGVTTLGELRAVLAADSDFVAAFDLGFLDEDDEDELITQIVDETGSPVTEGWDVQMIRDAYRIKIYPSDITWSTGNGYNHSSHFKSRGVKVGDRLRYSVVGNDSVTYAGTTQVAAIEADVEAAKVAAATIDSDNAAAQSGLQLVPHTGADVITAGDDNQAAFDGALTALYALSPDANYFPGDYSGGVLADTYTVTITTGGAPGTARATVVADSGLYTRTDVRITDIHWDAADPTNMAMLYLGNNLWAVLHDDTAGGSPMFYVGDTYTFTADVEAPWRAVSAARVTSSGEFTGPSDTTYKVEVVRGGVFTRETNVIDGLLNPNRATITYTDVPDDGDELTLAGTLFEFDNPAVPALNNPGAVQVDIVAGDADSTYANLAAAINAQAEHLYATHTAASNTVVVRGPAANIVGADFTGPLGIGLPGGGGTIATATCVLTPVMDYDLGEWAPGDVDDEYILRCTRAGTALTAQFELTSQRGDDVSLIEFSGTGVSATEVLGVNGLSGYFTITGGATFTVGDYWVIRINATRPRVRITDTAGIDQGSYEVVEDGVAFDLGLYGAELTFSANNNTEVGFGGAGGLVTGDVFYVVCTAEADGPNKVLVLADDLPAAVTCGLAIDDSGATTVYSSNYDPTEFSVWLYLVQSSAEISYKKTQSAPEYNWTASNNPGITVMDDIEVQDPEWTDGAGTMLWMPVYAGQLYVEYRALLSDYADAIYSLNDIADVATELSTVHPDNPLAQGVYNALLNSGDQPVYFMAVPSDDLTGYQAVLNQAEKTDAVYGLNPLTRSLTILAAVEAHINAMSGASEKKWRIGFVGTELPADLVVYDTTTHPTGGTWLATVTDNPAAAGDQYTLLECTAGSPTFVADVRAGDIVRINYATDGWGDATYDTYTVASVLSNTKLLLTSGPGAPINVASKFEIWHARSTAEIATAVAARSTYFGSRRMYHVFPNIGYMDGVAQTAEFLASTIAGLCSSVVPQQGLTHTEVNGFDSLPVVYNTYSGTQLDEMADAGTFILMQDSPGSEVYVRHQVSTAGGDDNILTTELSVTKNLDAISYYLANVLRGYIGRFNITDELLRVLHTEVDNGLNYLGSDQTGAGLIGPMLILGENTRIRSLEQHPTLQDHIVIICDLQLPLPVNVIQLHLVV